MKSNKLFWDSYASEFDAIYGTKNSWSNKLINKLFRGAMKLRFDKTVLMIPENNISVLDIGCGPGHYCFALAQSGNREILGIDYSETMIQLASEHANELDLEKKLTFKVINIFDFKPNRKFDYSIMMGFIEYFKNPDEVIRKTLEITNQKILISFPVSGGLLAFQRKLRYKSRCYLRLYSQNDIKRLLDDMNVKSYKIEKIQRDFFVTIDVNEDKIK